MLNFDSRDAVCKTPFGAVKENENIVLRVRLPEYEGANCVFLALKDDKNSDFGRIEMPFEYSSEGCNFYKTELRLPAGLYWYFFGYKKGNEELMIDKGYSSGGFVGANGGAWQLTVYRDEPSPEWLKGGIIYQIFPDRFNASGSAKENIPEERYLVENKEKEPEYRQIKGEKLVLGNDFYGGDLKGIEEKLPYLASLGASVIYLNPIFEASSNHRYNTGNYEKIDPMLGTEADFISLCEKANKFGIKIILDGVFSHTGDDSEYFKSAQASRESPYYSWYKFKNWPDDYHSWWGVETLPEVEETNDNYIDYICGDFGILRKWLRLGAGGWRLDVADELPDKFLDALNRAVKQEKSDAYILGEVWEDASNKISYGERRRYLLGGQLDSVMNYPFSDAIINYAKGGSAYDISETVLNIIENYPKPAVDLLMNHIGTHDTPRILTRLGAEHFPSSREAQSGARLNEEQRERAIKRLKTALVLQFTLPGIPSIYYGDEAGLEGFGDPFCRAFYPWGRENEELLSFYRALGELRRGSSVFKSGSFSLIKAEESALVYAREDNGERLVIALNSGEKTAEIQLEGGLKTIFGKEITDGKLYLFQNEFSILK